MQNIFRSLESLDHEVAVRAITADQDVDSYGDQDTEFEFASVTKLFSAYAALIAVQRHLITLDDPAGPEGATVRDLLAHTSGLPFEGREPISAPRLTRVYSNTGIEMLAEHVSEQAGMDFDAWLEEAVLLPLGLSSIFLDGSAAHGAKGNVQDLATFARELAAPTLLKSELWEEATHPVFGGLRGVLPGFGRQQHNDWGLGFEIKSDKAPHWTGSKNSPQTFGHFGQSGSFVWVDPVAHKSLVFLSSERFDDWARQAWPQLSDAFLQTRV